MIDEAEYIKERADDQIRWYSEKGSKNKMLYYSSKIIEIFSTSMIILLVNFVDNDYSKYAISLFSLVVAISISISHIFKFHENWISYRTTSESLKHEKNIYIAGCPPYNSEDSFCLFVENIESLISRENSEWKRVVQKQ